MGTIDAVSRRALIAESLALLLISAPAWTAGAPASPPWSAGVTPARQRACPEPVLIDVEPPRAGIAWWAEPGLEGIARVLAGHAPAFAPLPGIGPLDPPEGMRILLLRDLGCLAELGVSAPQPDWVAGLASAAGGFVALRADGPRDRISSLRAVLRHELAHVALEQGTSGRAPRWLHEGYAQLAAGAWDWQQAWRLRWTFLRGGNDRLRRISLVFPRDPEGARMAYLLSYTAVQELVSISGEAGLRAFLMGLGAGESADEAFRRVFGLTESQFEERWESSVRARYGLLYTLSRAGVFWLFVSILVVWVASRRRRHNRERLEAMREAEAREDAPDVLWRAVPPWPWPRSSRPGRSRPPPETEGREPPSRPDSR
jgi:hypothetical protein